jgi:transmembrane sensor
VSAATEKEFDAWLDQAAEHRASYMRCEVTLAMTRDLKQDADLEADFAACARIAAAQDATDAAERRGERRFVLRPAWMSAAAALVMAVAIGGYLFANRTVTQLYQTGIGEQLTVVLADDSTVTLNTDTSLSVALSDKVRRIEMQRGEAVFSVAHDKARPFEVWAAGGLVRAVGTEFGVEIVSDEVTVSVLEGAVVVIPQNAAPASAAPDIPRLDANKSVRYRAGGEVGAVQTADVRRIAAWREGKLVFDAVPLSEAIAEYNRYTTRKLVVGSAQIGRRPVNGVLKIGDFESLAFLLRESLGLRLVEQSGSVLLLPVTPAPPETTG